MQSRLLDQQERRPTGGYHTAMTDVDVLTRPFPQHAVKQRTIGGGMKASYLDGATVIRRLNEATGNTWDFAVERHWIEGTLSYALVTLTLPGCGSRQHIGVQSTDARSGEDAVAKGAITDALKKAASLFGVGLELYGPDYESLGGQGIEQSHSEVVDFATGEIMPSTGRVVADQLVTPRQLKYIQVICREQGLSDDDLNQHVESAYGVTTVDQLNRRDASAFIDTLQGKRNG